MSPDVHRRRHVTNLAQLFAAIHECSARRAPVCTACWKRAGMVYEQLRNRRMSPTQPVA